MSTAPREERTHSSGNGAGGTGLGALEFGKFLELIPDAIVVIDEAGRIVMANPQSEKLFGWPREELIGEDLEVLVPERFNRDHSRHRDRYLGDPRTRKMGIGLDLSGRRKDGSEFPADISLSAIRTPDGVLAAAAIRDLTERVRADREREALEAEARQGQARRLESIGELAGGIAHDFNNLLAVILNNSELALEDVPAEGELRQELEEIAGAAEHGAQLARQLLVFSRREAADSEPVDLNEVIAEMEQLVRRTLGERIEMDVGLAEGLPRVMSDASQMQQVLLNLVINARDAMPSGGRLGIKTALVELDEEYTRSRPDVVPGHYVRLTVADTGEGMPPEVVSRAFEPFFSTKDVGEGTGLGLATVYGIINQYEGHIAIYSEEGQGSVFRVHMPLAPGDAPEAGQGAEPPAEVPGGSERVLLVEDAERVRRTVSRLLRRNGYVVLEADRAEEALKLLTEDGEEVAMVLTDVVMPGMLGTELGKRLEDSHPDLPVLYMSGYADVASPLDDPTKLIEKPFTSGELLRRVREAIEGAG